MTTTTFPTETTGFLVFGAFDALADAVRAVFARRAQRRAIAALLELDPSYLDDLGINAGDVRDALGATSPAGTQLEARRRARALSWTPTTVFAA
jgi:uncharacterized protein YjiS (DUF1127 family)